ADTHPWPGTPRAPCRSTIRESAVATPPAHAGAGDSPTGPRCSESARDSRCPPSRSPPIEFRSLPRAVHAQRAPRSDRVRPLKDPILPCREPCEDLALERFRAREPERRLHARERVGRERSALLDRDAHLVVPIDVVRRERHDTRFPGGGRVEVETDPALQIIDPVGLPEE